MLCSTADCFVRLQIVMLHALEALCVVCAVCEVSAHARMFLQVSDAGRTQVLPGTVTVLAIAGPSETVDQVTGDLQTLR